MPTVPTFAVRETDVSQHNGGISGAPLKPPRDDSALRALSSLRGLRGAPEVPSLCRETQSLGQQILNTTMGINGLREDLNDANALGRLQRNILASKWTIYIMFVGHY